MNEPHPSITERLAGWIASVRYDDIPARVLDKARHQVASVVAACHAGAATHEGRAVHRSVMATAAPGPATILATGERVSVADAVTVSSAHGMALDYDDYLYMGHTGHSAVLASWAVCEQEGLDTRRLLTAQVVANEIGGRLGASAVLGPQNGQAWSFIHAAGAAAATAHLLGLDAAQTAHALGIALYQPTFTLWPGFMGPGSKVLTAAAPTVTGIQAAYHAREGLTGAREILEHPRKGFFRFFTFVPLEHMLTELGRVWVSDTLAYKRYPGCAYVDTTIDALLGVLDAYRTARGQPLPPGDVTSIRVVASLLTVEMDNLSSEHFEEGRPTPVAVSFSVPWSAALVVLAGRLTPEEVAPGFLAARGAELEALAARTTLEHDWSMTFAVAEAFDAVLGDRGVAASLRVRDLGRVARGYARELGGPRSHGIDVPGLAGRHAVGLARTVASAVARRRTAGRRPETLAGVDLTRFRMVFPAEVTVTTRDGWSRTERRDVPLGAPGATRHLEIAREKLDAEARRALGAGRAEAALTAVLAIDARTLADVTAAVAGTPASAAG